MGLDPFQRRVALRHRRRRCAPFKSPGKPIVAGPAARGSSSAPCASTRAPFWRRWSAATSTRPPASVLDDYEVTRDRDDGHRAQERLREVPDPVHRQATASLLHEALDSPATYTFRGNEGYVRAKVIESNGQVAWIQPVVSRRGDDPELKLPNSKAREPAFDLEFGVCRFGVRIPSPRS